MSNPPSDKHESLISPGSGIARTIFSDQLDDQSADVEEDVTPEPVIEDTDRTGKSVWSDKPTYEDQFWRYPETCKLSAPMVDVFKLKDAGDLERMNSLMARTEPASAPDIILTPGCMTQWSEEEATFVELVKYRKVTYKRLIKQL